MVCCKDFEEVISAHPELLKKIPEYNYVISWIELSNEGTFHKVHPYGVPIVFCPFCGSRLIN